MFRHRFPLLLLALSFAAAVTAAAKRPSAPVVQFRDPLHDTTDRAHPFARKLRLEAGAVVRSTRGISIGAAATDREKYLLLATEAVEGGFDAVNLYDRGIISWGLMQWAAHANSLQETLWYVKSRLIEKGKGKLWADLFKAQGLDIQRGPGGAATFFVGGSHTSTAPNLWRPIAGEPALRILFRGTRTPGRYDARIVARWGRVFARAGAHPTIQALQMEWATRRLRECLAETVDANWRVRDFTRGDLFSDALMFALWTNNPAACREHLRTAVRACRRITGEADPARWPAGLFPLLWEQTARTSGFGMWPQRAARIARQVPVGRIGRDRAGLELASRGWRLDELRNGGGRGKIWKGEPSTPPRLSAPPHRPAVLRSRPLAASPLITP